jgi:hypothetical protein
MSAEHGTSQTTTPELPYSTRECTHIPTTSIYECPQCFEEIYRDLRVALPNLLRQKGWSEDELQQLSTQTIAETRVDDMAPKAGQSHVEMDREMQVNLLHEMDRRVKAAEKIRSLIRAAPVSNHVEDTSKEAEGSGCQEMPRDAKRPIG